MSTALCTSEEATVLILAPLGRDAALAADALSTIHAEVEIQPDLDALLERLEKPCGSLLIAEEAFDVIGIQRLVAMLEKQPPWSDLQIIMLTSGGKTTGLSRRASDLFAPHGNVTFLERPLRVITLCSAVEVALRARRRQYQVRDLLLDREQAILRIRETSQAKDQFLAALSHELRTPLTPVLMSVASLRQDPALPPAVLADLEAIQRNVELEARLIDDLLDLTRITQGKLLLQTEVLDLNDIVDRTLENCRSGDAPRKRLHITAHHEARAHHTFGDPARLQQILWNLLNNATKFTPAGGNVDVTIFNPGPGIVAISVTDTGIGIEPRMLPKLFDAFQQGGASVTRQFGGLGLGLAICKTLAGLHGGTLRASSPGRDRGATFTLELKTAATPVKLNREAPFLMPSVYPPLNILLVEDHEPTRAGLFRLLTHAGHRVQQAETVAGALKLAATGSFDLVMSDVGLPDASGHDLMRELSGRYRLPGIALSGYGMEEDIRASIEAGFQAHVTKPVDWRRLEETLHGVISREIR